MQNRIGKDRKTKTNERLETKKKIRYETRKATRQLLLRETKGRNGKRKRIWFVEEESLDESDLETTNRKWREIGKRQIIGREREIREYWVNGCLY